MKRQVAFSFEDDLVRIVYASEDKDKLVVDKTIVLNDGDLDGFLQENKLSDIVVLYPFRKYYSDVIPTPPVKKKAYLDTIIREEIRKRYTDLKSFTFFYNVLAEKSAEEKGPRDVFFFVVDNEELDAVVERFERHGTRIKILCPDLVALSHLFRSEEAEAAARTSLGLLSSKTDKSLFLIKNGYIRFIRITPSEGKELQDTDIDNINMTIRYCQQQIRSNPEQFVLLNNSPQDGQERITIPVVCFPPPEDIAVEEDIFRDFIVPLSALSAGGALKDDNLLPVKYKVLHLQKVAMVYAIGFLLSISVLGLGYLVFNLAEIASEKGKIALLRKEMAGEASVMAGYDASSLKLQQMMPAVTLVNDARSQTGVEKALLALSELPLENIDLEIININSGKDSPLQMQIAGVIHVKNFERRYDAFNKLLNGVNRNTGTAIVSQKMDLKSGQFQIESKSNTP